MTLGSLTPNHSGAACPRDASCITDDACLVHSIRYGATTVDFDAPSATVTLLKQLIVQVAAGDNEPRWLDLDATPGQATSKIHLLLAPGVPVVLLTDDDFIELPLEVAIEAVEADDDLGATLVRMAREAPSGEDRSS